MHSASAIFQPACGSAVFIERFVNIGVFVNFAKVAIGNSVLCGVHCALIVKRRLFGRLVQRRRYLQRRIVEDRRD